MECFDYEKEHLRLLRGSLAECTVLLKTNGAFPLAAPCAIAAYGNGICHTLKGGTGSGEVNSHFFVSIAEGLTAAGFTITTDYWMEAYEKKYAEARKQYVKQVKAEARAMKRPAMIYGMGRVMPELEYDIPLNANGEAAIYILSRISGEGNDRAPVCGDIKLTETEKRDILALNRNFDKFMLVLNVGGPVDLSEVQEVDNILLLSQLGVETGSVFADILLGRANPSGKLSTTWSAWKDYANIGEFGNADDTRYREGVYVGYRYFDSVGKKALFPFGYGLSYTTFSLKVEGVSVNGSCVGVMAKVTNTGARPGKEVVQLYVSSPQGRLDKPYQALAAFAKTRELAPGEEETLTVSFDMRDVSSYDEQQSAYILEQGDYILRVGNSSTATQPAAVIRAEKEIIVRSVRKALGLPDFKDWRQETQISETVPENLPVLSLGTVETETAQYDKREEIDEAVKALTDEELAYANIGAFDPQGGFLNVVGNASKSVAGAAGETTSFLQDKGFRPAVMADGPSGLRLSSKFYRDEKGVHAVGSIGVPETMAEYMPAPVRWIMRFLSGRGNARKNVSAEYQYCTAIPIGTAVAQSWNLDFARVCGDIVGDEMERFGVHLWLAPALNIHRSILCGRNFEYFSEDPLMSGLFAAAITNGVQSHPGCGTTIKHFAANNQEYNRYGSNSVVSERAMREIYLRGFEICIRESQPHALMTSYNLLNGIHTAERRDLCQDILRCEFGFQGVVMTDWVIGNMLNSKENKYRPVQPHLVAAAGGDLFMPGSKNDYEDVLKGLRNGTLRREQLEINASRVLHLQGIMERVTFEKYEV